jgi:hypothetical protein
MLQSRSRKERYHFGGAGAEKRCGSGSKADVQHDCYKYHKMLHFHTFSIHIYKRSITEKHRNKQSQSVCCAFDPEPNHNVAARHTDKYKVFFTSNFDRPKLIIS